MSEKKLVGNMRVTGINMPFYDRDGENVHYNLVDLDEGDDPIGLPGSNHGSLSFFIPRSQAEDLPKVGAVVKFTMVLEEVQYDTKSKR